MKLGNGISEKILFIKNIISLVVDKDRFDVLFLDKNPIFRTIKKDGISSKLYYF